jgi:hypothetical protein
MRRTVPMLAVTPGLARAHRHDGAHRPVQVAEP